MDFAQPDNFDIEYVDNNNKKIRPVMIHRALLGSIERFTGVLLEHYAGHMPGWLSPVQIDILICGLFLVASLFLTFIDFIPTFIILVVLAALLLFLNNKFKINQGEVISNVLPYIEHSIGYYSVALTFLFNLKNILTPVWTVIAYSHESPPKFKTIVEINAFSGDMVTEPYSENINA